MTKFMQIPVLDCTGFLGVKQAPVLFHNSQMPQSGASILSTQVHQHTGASTPQVPQYLTWNIYYAIINNLLETF